MEIEAQDTDRKHLDNNVYSKVARCIWRLDLGFYIVADVQRICHIVQDNWKIISIRLHNHSDQPLWYMSYIPKDDPCLLINRS